MIIFDEPNHTYTDSETGEVYTSVTTIISEYEPEFDADYHSARIAKRECVPQQMILDDWAAINKRATDKGTLIHKIMEEYVRDGKRRDSAYKLYDSYEDAVCNILDPFKSVSAEIRMHVNQYLLAGTADLLYDHGDDFTIGDFKTNARFRFSSKYNERFFAPLEHLTVCEFNAYALQLSIYAYMRELTTAQKCRKLVVLYLEEGKWKPIHLNYMRHEAKALLDHWKESKSRLN